jgi:ubiquinone biosynthesis protein
MEFLDGIPATKFNKKLAGKEYDEYTSLKAVLGSSVRPWIERGSFLFHADPHPANILIMKHGKVGLLDFGLTSSFSKKDSEQLCDLLLAVYAQNLDLTIHHALALCHAPLALETAKLRSDIKDYLEKTRTSGFGFWFMGLIKIFVKNRIPLPYQLVLLGRNVVIVEGLFETVVPGKTTIEVMGDELKKGLYSRMFENIKSVDVGPILYALSEKLKESPSSIAESIEKYLNHPLDFIREVKEVVLGK